MKMRASQIERMLAKAEAALAPPERKWLRAIVDDTDGDRRAPCIARYGPRLRTCSLMAPAVRAWRRRVRIKTTTTKMLAKPRPAVSRRICVVISSSSRSMRIRSLLS